MEKKLVTIVIPIYKVEKFLDRCLESVVNQTYENLEIILVDDGSPDKCPQICDRWSNIDKRIKVIHKTNEGLGKARNSGIDVASGDYICFVDSDDYIDLTTIEKAINKVETIQAEIVVYGFNRILNDGAKVEFVPNVEKNVYFGEDVRESFLPKFIASERYKTNLLMSACTCLISTELIKSMNWRFVSERELISEDVYSLLVLYSGVSSVAILNESLYYYCENMSSLTHTYRKDRYEKIKYFYDKCVELCEEKGFKRNIIESIESGSYIANTIAAMKMIVKSDGEKSEKKGELKEIVMDSHFQDVLKNIKIKKEPFLRRVLLRAAKYRMHRICFFLLALKK